MLIDPSCIAPVAGILRMEDFTNDVCRALFEAMTDAQERGKDFDTICALDIAKTLKGEAAGRQWVLDCVGITPTSANVTEYANIVHNHAGMRMLNEAVFETMTDTDPKKASADLIGKCTLYLQGENSNRLCSLSDALVALYDDMQRKTTRIDLGFPNLDWLVKGVKPTNFMLIAARPGIGKSAFASDVAINNAIKGNRTAFFSLEMSREEIAERIIARRSELDMDTIIDNNLSASQWTEFAKASGALSKLPLMISDDPHLTVSKVRSEVRSMRDLKLIVIDYIQLMTPERKNVQRTEAVGSISRGLKLLAQELRIPIIALSQLNRGTEEYDRPMLNNLRDSGELEQDANKVIFLWKTVEVPTGAPQPVGAYVAKNRRGQTGTTVNLFDGAHMKFTETNEKYVAPKQKNRVYT